jgi:hypothetical protein
MTRTFKKPPPCDRCVYCTKRWRRIHQEYLYENEPHVRCMDESEELVHLYQEEVRYDTP